MNRVIFIVIAVALSLAAEASELPVKRVVLSTSGLAQFTHSGEIDSGAVIELPVRLDQVDDVLKSLTFFGGAHFGAVSLTGKAPLTELFRDLPFDEGALESQAALLNALVGAEVEIEGDVSATGRIFRVEAERVQLPNNSGQTEKHRLTLVTQKGFVQAILEDLTALRFTQPQLTAQIDRALAGLTENRAKERRTLAITFPAQSARDISFSYVVAAPVWKTSYRLVLPREGGKARLQGWGILENLTGGNWKDVDLTLVSGNPVALKQPLYTAVFAERPEIPISSSVRIVPRKDDAELNVPASALRYGQGKTAVRSFAAPSPKPAPPQQVAAYDRLSPAGQELGAAETAAEPEEAATQVIFRFPAKITLASGSTMMIPFVDREIAAARTYLYQPETNANKPLAAVRLRNEGDSALPAGLVTAFDTGADGAANFAGDAQLPLVPRGAARFITFALDTKTEIRRVDEGVKLTRLGTASRGKLTLTVKSRWLIDYEITPPADEDREIVIDEPRQEGWKPVGDLKDLEETSTRVRYKVAAPKGKTAKAALDRERVEYQSVSLTSLGPDQLLATVSGLQNENAALKDAIARLGSIVADINKVHARRRELETERKKIAEDQERIRKNLGTVGQGSDLGRRYLDTLKSQEDRLAALAGEDKTLDQEFAAKTKAADEIAQSLTL